MSETMAQDGRSVSQSVNGGQSLVKGMLAGMVGGLVAMAVKSVAEKLYSPKSNTRPGPEAGLANRVSGADGHAQTATERAVAEGTIHWSFGALTGAAYGGLAEYFPAATSKDGASFGVALAALTQEGALPSLGFSAKPGNQTVGERASEMSTDVVYGLTTETVRRVIRKLLG